jgi:hypothetical protein
MTSPRSVAATVQEAGDFGLTTQLSPKLHVSEGSTRSRHSSVDGDCVARLTTPAASILPDFKAHHQALRTVAATEVQIASPLMLTRMGSCRAAKGLSRERIFCARDCIPRCSSPGSSTPLQSRPNQVRPRPKSGRGYSFTLTGISIRPSPAGFFQKSLTTQSPPIWG